MSYENATKTKLFATNCCCCGRPLCDAESVEKGIGPECSGEGYGNGIISDAIREAANMATHDAAIAAQQGQIEWVKHFADQVRNLGLPILADKMMRRFTNADRLAKIRITEDGPDNYLVHTPFRRSDKVAFICAWRAIPGRRIVRKGNTVYNIVPVAQKAALWALLKKFFPNEYGVGPSGCFKIIS